MEEDKYVFRFYRISINIGPLCYLLNTKTYRLPQRIIPYLLGGFYTLINIFTGFLSLGIINRFRGLRNTLESIHYNMSVGIEMTDTVDESSFEERTNYVYRNMLRKTCDNVTKAEVELILDIYDEFILSPDNEYRDDILNYIIINLGKIDIRRFQREEIADVIDGVKIYEEHNKLSAQNI